MNDAIVSVNNQTYQTTKTVSFKDVCRQAGVPLNCHNGVCGSCLIEVLEGIENLSPPTQEELNLGVPSNQRLACQCQAVKGVIKIQY